MLNNMTGLIGVMPWLIGVIIIVAIFDLILKGIALWRAGNNKHLAWFIVLFIFNTAGILPLIYLLFVNKKKIKKKSKK
jgi:methionyl-tRNA synthetase